MRRQQRDIEAQQRPERRKQALWPGDHGEAGAAGEVGAAGDAEPDGSPRQERPVGPSQ